MVLGKDLLPALPVLLVHLEPFALKDYTLVAHRIVIHKVLDEQNVGNGAGNDDEGKKYAKAEVQELHGQRHVSRPGHRGVENHLQNSDHYAEARRDDGRGREGVEKPAAAPQNPSPVQWKNWDEVEDGHHQVGLSESPEDVVLGGSNTMMSEANSERRG